MIISDRDIIFRSELRSRPIGSFLYRKHLIFRWKNEGVASVIMLFPRDVIFQTYCNEHIISWRRKYVSDALAQILKKYCWYRSKQ